MHVVSEKMEEKSRSPSQSKLLLIHHATVVNHVIFCLILVIKQGWSEVGSRDSITSAPISICVKVLEKLKQYFCFFF